MKRALDEVYAKYDALVAPSRNTVAYPIDKDFNQAYPRFGFGPPIIQALARLDPFLYAVNAARALINGAILDPSVGIAFVVFAALSVITLAVFIRGMREAVA